MIRNISLFRATVALVIILTNMANLSFMVMTFWTKKFPDLIEEGIGEKREIQIYNFGYLSMTCVFFINPLIGMCYFRNLVVVKCH